LDVKIIFAFSYVSLVLALQPFYKPTSFFTLIFAVLLMKKIAYRSLSQCSISSWSSDCSFNFQW